MSKHATTNWPIHMDRSSKSRSLVSDSRQTHLGTVSHPRGDSRFPGSSAILKLLKPPQGRQHHSRIRSFASRPLGRFAFVMEARLTDHLKLQVQINTVGSGSNTDPLASTETYDTKRVSQKTPVNETLSVALSDRLLRS